MNRDESVRLLEERDARLGALTRVLEALERSASMVPIPAESEWAPPLVTALLEARLALEQEGVREPVPQDRAEMCATGAWCLFASGHDGACSQVQRLALVEDFGPEAAKRRRY